MFGHGADLGRDDAGIPSCTTVRANLATKREGGLLVQESVCRKEHRDKSTYGHATCGRPKPKTGIELNSRRWPPRGYLRLAPTWTRWTTNSSF